MKTLNKISLLAVASAALAFSSANAQLTTLEIETVSDWEGSIQSFNVGTALSQTFTGVLGVDSMTYRFVQNNGTSYNTQVDAYFVEWNPSTNRAVGATSLWSASLTSIPASNGGQWQIYNDSLGEDYLAYDFTLSPSMSSLNPNATYAMIIRATANLTNGASSTRLGLQNIPSDGGDSFAFGAAYKLVGTDLGQGYSYFTSNSSSLMASATADYGFQQITITPVPEPQTAAAILVVLFVAGLVARRVYLKRQEAADALVPVSAS